MSLPTNSPPNPLALKSQWAVIDNSRSEISKQIAGLAKTLTGTRRSQLESISRWFSNSGDYEAVLTRPDVLCFCKPWIDASLNKTNKEPLTESEIAVAIGKGFCKFENSAISPRDLTPFLYPAFALAVWILILTFGSIFLIPEFANMFEDFGIELPLATQRIIGLSRLIEANWELLFAFLFLLPLAVLLFLKLSKRNSAYSLSWLDRRFAKFRTKLSIWATHVASLLTVGVDQSEAIQIAGRCSTSETLRSSCEGFSAGSDQDLLDPTRYPLINNSLSLGDQAAKIAILEETARYYRAVGRVVQSWWLAWLSKAIIVMIVLTLFFVVASMFMPLISIVSGLTGG